MRNSLRRNDCRRLPVGAVRSVAGQIAAVILSLLATVPAPAQIAAGPGVNPRSVWSEPPERFGFRVVAEGFDDPWEVF